MSKLFMEIELSYERDITHEDSKEGEQWFLNLIKKPGDLTLYSEEVGDHLGSVQVLSIKGLFRT